MVSIHQPTSKSFSLFNNPLVIVPKAPITIGIIVTCMFHSFFNSLARSRYLSFFSHSFSFILWSVGTAKSTILQFLFFLLLLLIIIWPRLGHPSVCQSPRGVYVCYFLRQVHISLWITLPTQSCLVLYSFCIRLLCDWWFYLCHRIDYICYFVASYRFSLWFEVIKIWILLYQWYNLLQFILEIIEYTFF